MITARRRATVRPPVAQKATIAAPVLGWDAKSDIAAVPPGYAPKMDNWLPKSGAVEVRWGYESHATALPGAVTSLMTYRGATDKLFAVSVDGIYDVSSEGEVGAAEVSGLTETHWQSWQFNGRLFAVSGEDAPLDYDGSSWSATAWTGPSNINRLWNGGSWKSRVFLAERDTASFWYAPVNNIQGALTELDFAPLLPIGGNALAFGSWSRDAATTSPDELAVFVFDSGAVLVYQGTDPGNAASWAIVGRYILGRPLGPKCLLKTAGDLVILTEAGYASLARLTQVGRDDPQVYLSDPIGPAVVTAAERHGIKDGWEAISYPRGGVTLFNIPITGSTHEQHVLTDTGAWTRFRNIPSYCWAVHEDDLYFGGDRAVYLAAQTQSDAGSAITAETKSRFDAFGTPALKRFTMVRPMFASDAAINAGLALETDFSDGQSLSAVASSGDSGTTFNWGVSWNPPDGWPWGGIVRPRLSWQTVNGLGVVAALRVRISVTNQTVRWHGAELYVEASSGAL